MNEQQQLAEALRQSTMMALEKQNLQIATQNSLRTSAPRRIAAPEAKRTQNSLPTMDDEIAEAMAASLETLALDEVKRGRGTTGTRGGQARKFPQISSIVQEQYRNPLLRQTGAAFREMQEELRGIGSAGKGLDDLEGSADAGNADLVGSLALYFISVKKNFSLIGTEHTRDHIEAGGLAGAVGTDQRCDGACADFEGRLRDGLQAAERFRYLFYAQHHFPRPNLRASAGQMPLGRNITTASSTRP